MRVTDIVLDVVQREVPRIRLHDHRGAIGGPVRNAILRVHTDAGIEGQCTVGDREGDADALVERIVRDLKPRVLGMQVAARERLWSTLEQIGGHGAAVPAAWACVDVALWDAAGRAAGMPVHAMLGSARDSIAAYATYPPRHAEPAAFVDEALALQALGFSGCKLHPGSMAVGRVTRLADAVRQAVGDVFALMLDPNHAYDRRRALVVGRALDANDFRWFEDPVAWNAFDSVADLSRRLLTPIAISDAPGFGLREAALCVRLGHPSILRGSARWLGITGLKKLCSLLEGFGMHCEIGQAGNSSLNAANLNVALSVCNCDWFEHWLPAAAHQWGMQSDLEPDQGGMLLAPTVPGIGLVLDESWVTSHRIATVK